MGVPWLVTQNGGVAITVNVASVLIEGFNFWEDIYTTPIAIDAYWDHPPFGDNLVVRNCFFGAGLDHGIRLDFAYNTFIYHNTFQSLTTAAILSLELEGNADYTFIYENMFEGNAAAIVLENASHCMIYSNMINGNAAGTNNFIDLDGGSDNFVANNYLACTLGAEYNLTCSDADSGAWINNHCENGDTTTSPT